MHRIDLTTSDLIARDLAASTPFYEALLGGVAPRAAHSARPHDRTSAGLHHLAFRAAATLVRAAPTSAAPMS